MIRYGPTKEKLDTFQHWLYLWNFQLVTLFVMQQLKTNKQAQLTFATFPQPSLVLESSNRFSRIRSWHRSRSLARADRRRRRRRFSLTSSRTGSTFLRSKSRPPSSTTTSPVKMCPGKIALFQILGMSWLKCLRRNSSSLSDHKPMTENGSIYCSWRYWSRVIVRCIFYYSR